MSYIDKNKINTIIGKLIDDSNSESLLANHDIGNIIDNVLHQITLDTQEYIKFHRIEMYMNHHPSFFKPVVNHMLTKIIRHSPAESFDQFDMNMIFDFKVDKFDVPCSMKTMSRFTYHPFYITGIDSLNDRLRINLSKNIINFNY
ncbi:hypothetical protein OAO18_06410, partial [Francisellaceae bacterium]|nr:hypothetical protein [Francisellaceae bacterium]